MIITIRRGFRFSGRHVIIIYCIIISLQTRRCRVKNKKPPWAARCNSTVKRFFLFFLFCNYPFRTLTGEKKNNKINAVVVVDSTRESRPSLKNIKKSLRTECSVWLHLKGGRRSLAINRVIILTREHYFFLFNFFFKSRSVVNMGFLRFTDISRPRPEIIPSDSGV